MEKHIHQHGKCSAVKKLLEMNPAFAQILLYLMRFEQWQQCPRADLRCFERRSTCFFWH